MDQDAKPAREAGPPRPTTQIVVALLGLAGVLGAALIANWDKLFGTRQSTVTAAAAPAPAPAPTAAASLPGTGGTTGAQSPIVHSGGGSVTINMAPANAPTSVPVAVSPPEDVSSRLVGTWITAVAQNPYSANHQFRLRLRFERFGSQLMGTTTDIGTDAADGHAFDIVDLKLDGRTATFRTESAVLGKDGERVPYQTTYRLELDGQTLRITRRNNVSSGGAIERFEARREPPASTAAKAPRD